MNKNRLLVFPFSIGIVLMVYSWYLSYPLSIDSLGDFVFNHVSFLYWFSLALILPSMYMIAANFKSDSLKLIMTVSLVMAMYSLSYFFSMVPGADSNYFRGLTEYFNATGNLTPINPEHAYLQWPLFFLLSNITTSISGLGLIYFEFMLYAIIGFLLVTALYAYASKAYRDGGFLAVVGFFIMMISFLNYQCVPFSLAFALLFLLFMLETHLTKSQAGVFVMIILFTAIAFTHAFVAAFFVLYKLMFYILRRNRRHFGHFMLTLAIYLAVLVFQAEGSLVQIIKIITSASSEYTEKVEATLAPASLQLDIIAQTFSRSVIIATAILCFAGFVVLLINRKMRDLDKAVFLSGAVYSALGGLILLLGLRALPIVAIPVSLGASYLFESRFRRYLKPFFLVLLILFLFIPLHQSFNNEVQFQTREAYIAENFFINYYNWTKPSITLADFRVIKYLQPKLSVSAYLSATQRTVKEADTIFYTVGLGKSFSMTNYTMERMFFEERLNVMYNNGFSYIATRAQD